jgi:hypothetical protein
VSEEPLDINGMIFYCRHLTDSVLYHPSNPRDVELLLKELRARNIGHQLDYDRDDRTYNATVWVIGDEIENKEIAEYSYANECPFYAFSMAAALMVRYAIED